MRLWTLHPRYLDRLGLVALWREALLAQAVLCGRTRGYRAHPQLERFRQQSDPIAAISAYLLGVYAEAVVRGYRFDHSKVLDQSADARIQETDGQLFWEWSHLRSKLRSRAPEFYDAWAGLDAPEPHQMFDIIEGPVRTWERQADEAR